MKLWLGGSTIVIPTVIAIPGATRYSQRGFSLGLVNRGHGVPRCCGSRFRASELMYLMNGYLVFKVHEGACDPLTPLLQHSRPESELFSCDFSQKFQRHFMQPRKIRQEHGGAYAPPCSL